MRDGAGQIFEPDGQAGDSSQMAHSDSVTSSPSNSAIWEKIRKTSSGKATAGIGAVVVVYLVVAGLTWLPPFSPRPTPTPSPTPGPAQFRPTSADLALNRLVPAGIKSAGHCLYESPAFTAIAEVDCVAVANAPAARVDFYLFGGSASLNTAYSDILTQQADTSEDSGNCGSFTAFATCETPYGPGDTTAGRIVEYEHRNNPDIAFTVDKHLLLINTQGVNGDILVRWWARLPPPWLSATS